MDSKAVMVGLALDRPNDAAVLIAGDIPGLRSVLAAWKDAQGARCAERRETIAADIGAGFPVAGADGCSHFREWVRSRVTQHLATESRRCAFLTR